MKLVFENLCFSYPGKTVLRGVSGEIVPGKMIFLLGANGSGKSTLIRLLAGIRKPQSGEIRLDGRALETLSRRDCARHFGVVRQCPAPEFDYTAREFVLFGRNAKMSPFSGASETDFSAADRALERTGLAFKSADAARTFSGGEFQRLCLGAALALEGDFLLLDEPVSAQDAVHSERVMNLLREESKTRGVLVVSHDLALAARFADEVWLLADGVIFAAGAPENALDAGTVGRLYGCRAEIAPGMPQYRFP